MHIITGNLEGLQDEIKFDAILVTSMISDEKMKKNPRKLLSLARG
jgi:hypothetical protein